MTYKYWVENEVWRYNTDDLREFECILTEDHFSEEYWRRYLSECAALHYYKQLEKTCDYWAKEIVYVFYIFREDGYMLGVFSGECEYVPSLKTTEQSIECPI